MQEEEAVWLDMADGCIALSRNYCLHREYENAVKMQKNALFARKKLYELDPCRYIGALAQCHTTLGYLYLHAEKYALCEKNYRIALALSQEQKDMESADFDESLLASCYWNLGALYYRQRRYGKMRKVLQAALPMYEKLAEKDPDTYEEDVLSLRLLMGLR